METNVYDHLLVIHYLIYNNKNLLIVRIDYNSLKSTASKQLCHISWLRCASTHQKEDNHQNPNTLTLGS